MANDHYEFERGKTRVMVTRWKNEKDEHVIGVVKTDSRGKTTTKEFGFHLPYTAGNYMDGWVDCLDFIEFIRVKEKE